jgi:uncharacterized protein YdeI (YjbR/CyaY-like superfamily)
MKPKFFATQNDFRKWLEENHDKETELLVGFYKVGSGKPSMNWSQSVDEVLCFGWIDGVRRSIDGESYSIRFTPRRAKSIWSAVNIKKVAELTEKGLMRAAGLAAFAKRDKNKSAIYAYENKPTEFPEELEKMFRANESAWSFFEKQANGYRRTLMFWVLSAKQHSTQIRRLEKLIEASASGKKLL